MIGTVVAAVVAALSLIIYAVIYKAQLRHLKGFGDPRHCAQGPVPKGLIIGNLGLIIRPIPPPIPANNGANRRVAT